VVAPSQPIVTRGRSEFGEELAELVLAVPGALGAVITDGRGFTVDFAHVPASVDDIDVQLAGAQFGQAAGRIAWYTRRHRLGAPEAMLLECARGNLLIAPITGEYVLALLLRKTMNVARALREFPAARRRLLHLMR
jgi:predicted regulator of Ras-like GTPase activity (Roadblock/LC7/MglB family)